MLFRPPLGGDGGILSVMERNEIHVSEKLVGPEAPQINNEIVGLLINHIYIKRMPQPADAVGA